MLNYGLTWKIMGQNNLLHWQKDTSSFLKIELDRVANETGFIDNVRGYGTHLAFDCANEELADIMQRWLFRSGIHVLKCGSKTLGLRPALDLSVQDAAHLRDSLLHFHPDFEAAMRR